MPLTSLRIGVPKIFIAEQGTMNFDLLQPTTGGITFKYAPQTVSPDHATDWEFNKSALTEVTFKLLASEHWILTDYALNYRKLWHVCAVMPLDAYGDEEVRFISNCKLEPLEMSWTKTEAPTIPLTFTLTEESEVISGAATPSV